MTTSEISTAARRITRLLNREIRPYDRAVRYAFDIDGQVVDSQPCQDIRPLDAYLVLPATSRRDLAEVQALLDATADCDAIGRRDLVDTLIEARRTNPSATAVRTAELLDATLDSAGQ